MPLKTAFPWEEVSDPSSYGASEISIAGCYWLYNHTVTLHKTVYPSDQYHRPYTPVMPNPYADKKRRTVSRTVTPTAINDGDTVWRISDY